MIETLNGKNNLDIKMEMKVIQERLRLLVDTKANEEAISADMKEFGIQRGMVVSDPSKPHGLKLVIEDYPYTSDGLMIWEAVQNWVKTYVNLLPRFRPSMQKKELQAQYAESINMGHADLRHKDEWPTLASGDDLQSYPPSLASISATRNTKLS
ncbi:lipoxygenase 1 [Artemisia annua]|uniref:Lipoxygenase 1 n=1 Tax=Artemisia annua TaxID=35608 RepID=A0A2U1LFE1_ARTAN|nr:lipoxygenase 1 [Artemisia annua]